MIRFCSSSFIRTGYMKRMLNSRKLCCITFKSTFMCFYLFLPPTNRVSFDLSLLSDQSEVQSRVWTQKLLFQAVNMFISAYQHVRLWPFKSWRFSHVSQPPQQAFPGPWLTQGSVPRSWPFPQPEPGAKRNFTPINAHNNCYFYVNSTFKAPRRRRSKQEAVSSKTRTY